MPFELREMDFGTIIDRGLKLFKDNFIPSVIIIAIFMGPLTFVINYSMGMINEAAGNQDAISQLWDMVQGKEMEEPPPEDPFDYFGSEDSITTTALFIGFGLIFLILTPIAYLGIFWIYSQYVLGLKISIGQAIKHALSRFWILVGANILCGLIMSMIIIVLSIIAGIIISASPVAGVVVLVIFIPLYIICWFALLICMFILPCVVSLEDSGARESLSRVFWLIKGYFWRTFGIYFLASLLVGVVTSIFQMVGQSIGAMIPGTAGTVFTASVSTMFGVIFQPITYAIIFLIYLDLRIRKEGFDLNILAQRAYGNTTDSAIPSSTGTNDSGN